MANGFINDCALLARLYGGMEQNYQNVWESLEIFLRDYAFARQGASQDYSSAAVDIIKSFKQRSFLEVTAGEVWNAFSDRLNGEKLNHKNNPLCPKGVNNVEKYSVIEVVQQKLNGESVVLKINTFLQQNNIRQIHNTLQQINGIGSKIASFFLRDVSVSLGVFAQNDRYLLQPVDTWIRFCIQTCARNIELTDNQIAQYIVDNAAEPEQTNQGMWYFCSRVAESSKYVVRHSIENPNFRADLIRKHCNQLITGGETATEFLCDGRWPKTVSN